MRLTSVTMLLLPAHCHLMPCFVCSAELQLPCSPAAAAAAAAADPNGHAEDAPAIDAVVKLDLTNAQQLQLLHRYFGHNQATIDFWLTHCVLPRDSRQCASRLTATAWHLADNAAGAVVGFSGTNDHHRLLPLQVQQEKPQDEQLQGTNGKMLQLLLTLAEYKELQRPSASAPRGGSGSSSSIKQVSYCS
jgi:hypothetical protein